MERYRGKELLSIGKFPEFTLPYAVALDKLTQQAHQVVLGNAAYTTRFLSTHKSADKGERARDTRTIRRLHEITNDIGSFVTKGGLFVDEPELNDLYNPSIYTTFNRAVNMMIGNAESLSRDTDYSKRTSFGVTLIGYFMDLLSIFNEDVASREAGIEAIIESMITHKNFSLEKFGRLIQDAISGSVPTSGLKDLLADRRGASAFRDNVLEVATPDQRELILVGINMQRQRMVWSRNKANLNNN